MRRLFIGKPGTGKSHIAKADAYVTAITAAVRDYFGRPAHMEKGFIGPDET
ncbi:hypothetical protein [Pseudoduganella sp. UC29_71]|uniref:hypothetical protein n=1 Tax=Pseudoduganella sp. UC29_71 TaxID=3350174 RepID=UPI00366DFB55